ncbi:MAG TPA: shikimate dehydrogenase [Burkholderiales bacterium]|nr:shikimate dehydrogenase [Burkholderiales bacterium]
MPDRYAIIGNPVAHSKSPEIHARFARQTGQDIEYTRLFAPLDGFRATVLRFRDAGAKGCNVTLPFKLEAFALCVPSARASEAGAVNTLSFEGDGIAGDNTDGVGLVRDLEHNMDYALAGRRILLMGAGGAAQGVLRPLLERGPAALVVANRTVGRAEQLCANAIACRPGAAAPTACAYERLRGPFDLVVNATSASLDDALPPLPPGLFAAGALAYDMVYGRELTPFLRLAREQGCRVSDGAGMLVEQAAESFLIWRGVRPETAAVIEMLRGGE